MPTYIELPDFVTPATVELAYKRSWQMQATHKQSPSGYSRAWRHRGVRAAVVRDGKLLKWLALAAELLRSENDAQQDRFAANDQDPHRRAAQHNVDLAATDFTEFATFREALLLADEYLRDHNNDGDCDPEVFGWIYGAAAEQVFGSL